MVVKMKCGFKVGWFFIGYGGFYGYCLWVCLLYVFLKDVLFVNLLWWFC